MHNIVFLVSILLGFFVNLFLTRPNTKLNKRFPDIKIKFIQIFPRVQIHFKNKSLWLHHWLNYSLVLIIILTMNAGFLESVTIKGYLVGSIFQGLTYPDWKTLFVKKIN